MQSMGKIDSRKKLAARKRHAVLDAATEVFLRDGYERASMDAIAQRADVSTATLYKHGRSKSALFGMIIARAWDVGDDEPDSANRLSLKGSPRAALTAIGRHYANSLLDSKVLALFRTTIAEFNRYPELGHDLYVRAKRPYLERIERYLQQQHAQGVLIVPKPASTTRQFLGMINDQVFWPGFLVPSFQPSENEVADVVREAVITLLARIERPGRKNDASTRTSQ